MKFENYKDIRKKMNTTKIKVEKEQIGDQKK